MRSACLIAISALLLSGCPGGPFAKLPDAPAAQRAAAEALWAAYQKQLADRAVDKKPVLLARFFAGPLIASVSRKDFRKRVQSARHKLNAGLFEGVRITAVKKGPEGLVMVIDSKAGEAGIPLVVEGEGLKFADLEAPSGDFASALNWAPAEMPDKPSLLYLLMVVHDDGASVGKRLRAAVSLAESKYRKQIVEAQKAVDSPIVKLGLGLARVKIDGYDASFIRDFPHRPEALAALQKADAAIFEEMVVKLTNMGSMVEDPPANEALYRATAGAPEALRARFGKALYEMAEANPARFVNAVFSLGKDQAGDSALAAYLAQVKEEDHGAPKLVAFLKQFSRQGEPAERAICRKLLGLIRH